MNRKIDSKIQQYKKKLDDVNLKIKQQMKLYGSPSVYWNQEELYTSKRLLEEFLEELEELK